MSNFNYLFFDFYQEKIEFSKVNENDFNNYYYKYIYKKIGVNQNNEIYYNEEQEEDRYLSQSEIYDFSNNEYTFSELMYSINDQLENYKDLFFFPFSLILKNLEENFDEDVFLYLKKFLESKEKKLYTLLEKSMSKIEFKKYSKKEEQFFGNKAQELEEEFKNIFEKYLKGIFIKLTLDTLACKQYRDKIEQLKVLYSYMSKKNWFKFCTLEIKSFLKNYYTNDNSNFDFENIDRFIYFLENNSKDDSDMLYNDISRTQLVDKFGFDFNLDLDFIIEEYVKFFNISLIMLDKDVDLENNRNTKTINKKINFLNCIFEYYFNEKEIVKASKLSEREINVLTNKKLLNSVESYQSTFKEILKNSFSKESLEVLKYSELSEDNFHIHISKLWLNYDALFYDIKIEINKVLLRIINLIRKNLGKNPYKSRQLENNRYLEVFKIEILNLNLLNIGTKHSVYKSLLKVDDLLNIFTKLKKIIDRINKHPRKCESIFISMFQGVSTGKDSVYFLHNCKEVDESLIEGYSQELEKIITIEKGIIKPLLKGEMFHRYDSLATDSYIVYPYNNKNELYSEDYLKNNYPLCWDYLKLNETILRDREGKKFNTDNWFQFAIKQEMKYVNFEKLITPEISLGCNFSYDKKGYFYHTSTVYGYVKKDDTQESYKFLMSILNSKVLLYYLINSDAAMANGYFRFKTNYIKPFPIPEINDLERTKPFEILVDYITFLKKEKSKFNNFVVSPDYLISFYEDILNSMVYELYFDVEMKENDLEIISFSQKYILNIVNINIEESIAIIKNTYLKLSESENELRNNIILMKLRLEELIGPIDRSI